MKILVTGGASGIGLALARQLATTPWNGPAQLVLTGRNAAALEAAAASVRELGAEVVVAVADLNDVDAPERVVEQAATAFGGLDGLVSNAGMFKLGPLEQLPRADFDEAFHVNTRATWLLAKAAYPLLKAARGSIVATSSLASILPAPQLGGYSASKAALAMLIQQMAVEWGEAGIRCNCVSPGSTLTPMTAKVYANPAERAKRERGIALHRIGRPEEVANAIAFLLGPQSSFITGINLVVDGGAHLMFMSVMGSGSAHQHVDA
jgi:NAD(P)-dependent dehydrogenase (short-subunit alcohol dehydrogenase family)